jgi:hypothetical protein
MRLVARLLLVGVILALPRVVSAQEATLSGTVTDATGGVLPGVTITAVHEASGNRFEAVTDDRGIFRIPARVGTYQITAALQGFTSVTRAGLSLLVGQVATMNLQMSPSSVQETVTVTAEAPLINIATANLGGNIDPQQVQELPVQGRNWMALAMLAPGSRMNNPQSTVPNGGDRNGGEQREFNFSLDGQQVSSEAGYGAQPRYSQESIAEFQFIANQFDATMGRSTGVQVKAITRSGTNRLTGSLRGNFRNSRFNAPNPVIGRVVPIDNQQIAPTVGGPILKDRMHFFAFYEYERQPQVSVWNTPYPAFNVQLEGNETRKIGGLRIDYQLSSQTRLMGKLSEGRHWLPFTAGNNSHAAATGSTDENNREDIVQLTQVFGNRAVNEVTGGFTRYHFYNENLTTWSNHWQKANGVTTGSPRITFTGFTIGGNQFYPRHGAQAIWSLRDNFSFSYDARGRHDLKTGADSLYLIDDGNNCQSCMGQIDARGGVVPSNIQALFPDSFNADTWNLAAISGITRTYDVGVGNFATRDGRPKFGTWLQDDWQMSSNLTLNLGVRYELSLNGNANQYSVPGLVAEGRANDKNNVQPRLGFAYRLNDKTVLRGGSGLYFAEPLGVETYFMSQIVKLAVIQYTNDGRPDFAANPTNGQPLPTYEQALLRFCSAPNVPAADLTTASCGGRLRRTLTQIVAPQEYTKDLARTWQTSIGFQRQVGTSMAFQADYVYSQGRHEKDVLDNINLTYNPATGVNYPFSDITRRAFPQYAVISAFVRTASSKYHALQTAWTKRLSNRWQGSATYTLSGLWDTEAQPLSGLTEVAFPVAADLGNDFTLSAADQRHRAVFNGIWQVGRGFQASGLVFLGVGQRSATTYGGDLRGLGANGSARLRPNGTIVPRNDFTQPARKRVDLRLQQRIALPGGRSIDGIAEVFNIFNSPNWTITTQESNAQFNQRTSGENRTAQLGFRLTF